MPRSNKIAEDLCILFHEALLAATPKRRIAGRAPSRRECKGCGAYFLSNSLNLCDGCRGEGRKARTFDELDATSRKAFLAAQRLCIELDADPREFIVAQFAMWREASAFHKRMLLPSPHHLGTLAAHVRYVKYKAKDEMRASRRDDDTDEQDDRTRWHVEERKLQGLARTQRRDPLDLMTEEPELFSRGFLTHKGVWDVVSELWEERNEQ